ncbi:MAG TPA: DUF6644 family protein [Myxococcaceae bacterium]|jgi:uncharacterized membrane protein
MHGIRAFCAWLERTPFSHQLQTREWAMPAVQTVHLLAIAALMGAMLLLNLRFLNLRMKELPVRRVAERFLPVMLGALGVLLVSGAVMIAAEPERALLNPVFALKMGLLAGVLALSVAMLRQARRATGGSDKDRTRRRLLGVSAVISTGLWVAVLFAGRWIAYARS